MNLRIQLSTAALSLFALTSNAIAQDVYHDGIKNSPLGSAAIGEDATGILIVSNLGSSGLDGVRMHLDNSQGGSFEADLALGATGRCELKCEVQQQGVPVPGQLSMRISGDGTGNAALYSPDFSAIGQQTYTLRLSNNGQLVLEQGGLNGPTKMQLGGGFAALPQTAYMTVMPFGPWGGAYLECFNTGGGTIVTPPGGTPVVCDFVEFLSAPAQITEVVSIEVLADVGGFSIDTEEMRVFNTWSTGLDDARLTTLLSGALLVDNLGSSGCDGVSINPGPGTGEIAVELEELVAGPLTGATVVAESVNADGQVGSISLNESGGEWTFTPDLSQIGSPTYTLELHNQGQVVFQQSGMQGPAVSTAAFSTFYKKTTTNGTTSTTEWCIGGGASAAHSVVGGPVLQADMFIVRSEPVVLGNTELRTLRLRAGFLPNGMTLNSVTSSEPCVGSSFCLSAPNSAGPGALLCSSGSSSVANNDLVLSCTGLPANKFGIYFYGPNQIEVPFGNGWRCVGGQLHRLAPQLSDASGAAIKVLDNTAPPTAAGQISAGQVWNFQFWYRDPAAGGAGYNLSDGHAVTFTP